ncbi:hypothetical protein pdam_00008435 [Pocillopora damicornis]|uniref:Ig-like domain-containing protein n=1 Tax=Pocillopora damicornis TaxID=46731 RepID=A0A3M6TVQ7_POCDA|nr:uncharacterized protein LOC113672413 [Pocillopora damicornis]RMX45505.1 hypothetical protein pdam_00008435 [Pocillopora damicornis]
MKNQYFEQDVRFMSRKVSLLLVLSFTLFQDVSSAPSSKCEVKASCSESASCQITRNITVNPGLKIPPNCAINVRRKGNIHTWQQAKQQIGGSKGSLDLVLQEKGKSKNGKYICQCTAVHFTRAVNLLWGSSSPNIISKDKKNELECVFSAWPLPAVVNWYKDKLPNTNRVRLPLMNGTKGIYQSLEKIRVNEEEAIRSVLRFPLGSEEHEGFYTCSVVDSIQGWSSNKSYMVQLIFICPRPQPPTTSTSMVSANKLSNVSLTCLVDSDETGCPDELHWYKNNDHVPLASSKKYNIVVKHTHSKCKQEFILNIFNVTKVDEGNYSCQWKCEYEDTTKASIVLKVST